MATQAATAVPSGLLSLVAGETFAAKDYRFVIVATENTGTIAGDSAANVIGVSTNNPASGETLAVQCSGIAKVTCGGSVTVGAYVNSDANGKAVAESTNNNPIDGIALQAGDDGDVISIVLTHMYISSS